MKNQKNRQDYPAILAEILILQDGSVGFTFKGEGLDVWKKADIQPEKMRQMLHGVIDQAWYDIEESSDALN